MFVNRRELSNMFVNSRRELQDQGFGNLLNTHGRRELSEGLDSMIRRELGEIAITEGMDGLLARRELSTISEGMDGLLARRELLESLLSTRRRELGMDIIF